MLFGKASDKHRSGYTVLQVQELDDRIVPAAPTTTWSPAGVDVLWSNPHNWSAGVPDATKIAIFTGSAPGATYDNTVPVGNRTVLGLQTQNGFSGTLNMTAGYGLTVAADRTDVSTGFQWGSGTIAQTSLQDVLIIGGGAAANNQWSGGSITNPLAQSNLYINGSSTLQVTGNADTLGDNVVVGQDGNGGSTLEFYNQARTLTVTNNAAITVSNVTSPTPVNPPAVPPPSPVAQPMPAAPPPSVVPAVQPVVSTGAVIPAVAPPAPTPVTTAAPLNPYTPPTNIYTQVVVPNRILFDTDVTQAGIAEKGIARDNATSFIDNYGTITRSGGGAYQIDLPIRNEASSPALLDLQSSLWISGRAVNGTANYAVDQEGGETRLGGGATLTVQGYLLNGGLLDAPGNQGGATIAPDPNYNGTLLTMNGGALSLPSTIARLTVDGDMRWTGGVYQAWIDGTQELVQSRLTVIGELILPANNSATLHVNVLGEVQPNLGWSPLYFGSRTGDFRLDAPAPLAGEWFEPFGPGGPGYYALGQVAGLEQDVNFVLFIDELPSNHPSTGGPVL